jgi:hypothetical protein
VATLFTPLHRLGSRLTEDLPQYGGIPVVNIFHARDVAEDAFLVGIDLSVPMDCDGMVEVEQIQGPSADAMRTTAVFPACSYDSLRSSGIYSKEEEEEGGEASNHPRRAEITSYLYHIKLAQDTAFSVIAGGKNLQAFLMPPSSRALARDRPDFRQGRFVEDIIDFETMLSMGQIEAIQIGSISFPVASVVYATGKSMGTQGELQMTEYGFVAAIEDGKCPEDPDGIIQPSCLAVLNVHCQTFPEDAVISLNEVDPDFYAICLLLDIELLWGRNFQSDRELTVAVAGVYGRNRLVARSPYESVLLSLHLIPAALVLMSSIDTMSSQVEVVAPNIGALYIFFMALPLLMSLVAIAVVAACKKRKSSKRFVIPDEPWKLAAVGNETNAFPSKRRNCHEEFPEATADLQYGILGRESGTQRMVLGILLPGMTKKNNHHHGGNGYAYGQLGGSNGGTMPSSSHTTPPTTPTSSPKRSRKNQNSRQSNRSLDQPSLSLPQVVHEIAL